MTDLGFIILMLLIAGIVWFFWDLIQSRRRVRRIEWPSYIINPNTREGRRILKAQKKAMRKEPTAEEKARDEGIAFGLFFFVIAPMLALWLAG